MGRSRVIHFSDFGLLILCLLQFFQYVCSDSFVSAVYPDDLEGKTEPGGQLMLASFRKTKIILVGNDIGEGTVIALTPDEVTCVGTKRTKAFNATSGFASDRKSASFDIELGNLLKGEKRYHICLKVKDSNNYVHQGVRPWTTIGVYEVVEESPYLLPLWLQISICTVLLVLSGLFSGLNLGLMALDQTELEIIERVGSAQEREYAKRIFPLRKRGNFLLCTLLLGNVMVNSTFTILFDNLTNGLIAILCSTAGIVVFGEIIPQAICSRHGLAVGARTYWLTRFFMVITFPASYPISLILDKILGEEMGQVYNKEKLQELIRMTADRRVLHDNEANIISGALQLTNKSVDDIMTKIEDVYMLEVHTVLDFETMSEIMRHGYTRIPVYEGEKTNIVNLLNTKDLALIDPDDNTLLSTVCKFYDHKPLFVDFDLTLDAMLQEFLQGNSHMAIVQKLHNNEDQDPYFENVGVVTLEDVIEEILQSEIVDETDMMTDNRLKELRPRQKQDYAVFGQMEERSHLPKQLAFVAFQFLSTNVEPFSEEHLNRNVLKNLMKKDIVVNLSPREPVTSKNYIYEKGVHSDRFVLILQGTVEVTVGGESMVFETGPFSYFGVECISNVRRMSTASDLKVKDYIPDFSVRALTDVQYLCIQRSLYMAAVRTTKMMRHKHSTIAVGDTLDAEYVKLTEGNTNINNTSVSSSPPKMPLDALKYDESVKKISTSSLDRITLFHRKPDSHEALYRMRRSGSDAKVRHVEVLGEMDAFGKKHFVETQNCKNMEEDGIKNSPQSISADNKSKSSNSSLPFTTHNNHKLNFSLSEENDFEVENNKTGAKKSSNSSEHFEGAEPPSYESQRGTDHVIPDHESKGEASESMPLVLSQPHADSQDGAESHVQVSQGSGRSSSNSKDSERIPLMHQEESCNVLLSSESTKSPRV